MSSRDVVNSLHSKSQNGHWGLQNPILPQQFQGDQVENLYDVPWGCDSSRCESYASTLSYADANDG